MAIKRNIFRLFQDQRGFSLLEILISVGIMAVIGTAVIISMDTNYRGTRTLDERVTAVNLTTAYIEAIRNLPVAATYPTAGDNITVPDQYTVTVTTYYSSDAETYYICTEPLPENATLQKIFVTVSREGRTVFSNCAYRNRQ